MLIFKQLKWHFGRDVYFNGKKYLRVEGRLMRKNEKIGNIWVKKQKSKKKLRRKCLFFPRKSRARV